MEDREPYRDSIELQDEHDQAEDADSPLPLHADEMQTPQDEMSQEPRWMSTRKPNWEVIQRHVIPILRPRPTWQYVLCSLLFLYVSYCFLRGSPLLASKLPAYTGQYGVGTIDVEIALDQPRRTSDTVYASTGKPAFEMETVLFSVFYPAAIHARSKKHRHYWFSKPLSATGAGYSRAAHVDNFIMRPVFTFGLWLLASSITIPAEVDVPILQATAEKYPVVVFSHGTASSRTDYTYFCGELASRGIVVAALEHRDGSGPASLVFDKNGKEKRRVMYMSKTDLLSETPLTEDDFKREQLSFREAEMEEVIRILKEINSGHDIASGNLRGEKASPGGWKNKLDFDKLIISGHSYGATGALQALKKSKARPAVGGIILDPGKSSGRLNTDIDVPILVVHSASWSSKYTIFFGSPHFDTVRNLVADVLDRIGSSWFITSLGTSHPSVTDAPLIEPLLLSWTTGATINVKEGLREYVRVSMEFIKFLQTGTREGVLAQDVTHPTYNQDERTEKQKEEEPDDISKYWQIHVAPRQ